MPASYANSTSPMVPFSYYRHNDPNDRVALNGMGGVFRGTRSSGLCGDLGWGLGTIHCLTQQQQQGITTGK